MALMIVPILVLASVAASSPIYPVPLVYVALSPIPENIYNQVQDTKSGEYAFGYSGGPVAREEARTADGVTRGAYSYVDAHGIVQYYRYVADADGFRVAGTNIPTDEASSHRSLQLEQPVKCPQSDQNPVEKSAVESAEESAEKSAVESAEKSAGESAEKSAGESAEKSAEKSAAASSRRKRSLAIENLYTVPAAPLALASVSVPTATSSQSRVQIHNNLKAEIHTPVEAYPAEAVAVPAVPVVAKTIEAVPATIPLAYAASVPTATSSQSRFQIHKSLKTEITPAIPVVTVEETPAIAEIPVETKSIEGLPAVSIETKTVEALPVAAPVAVAASVPTATSSQHRFQIHKSLKTEFHQPIDAIPVAIAPVQAAPIPTLVKTIESPAIPLIAAPVATATSNQRRFQVHNNAKLEFETLAQQPGYKVVDPKSVIPVDHGNSFSLPLIARNPVGVGLGVVSSPLVAYATYGTTLVAEP